MDTINFAVSRVLRSKFLNGNFDSNGTDPYASIPYFVVDSLEHKLLTKQVVKWFYYKIQIKFYHLISQK
jgi:hypothetical protein